MDDNIPKGKFIGLRGVNVEQYQKFRERCVKLKLTYGEGFNAAIDAWILSTSGDDLMTRPPFNTGIYPKISNMFRDKCKELDIDQVRGISTAITVWLRNFAFLEPYGSTRKIRFDKGIKRPKV